jgi:cell division protein FtsI (penicillin-binding protein 3)
MSTSQTTNLPYPAGAVASRARLFGVILLCCFALLAARLIKLQYLMHAEMSRATLEQMDTTVSLSPWRGEIVDCHNRPLAISVRINSCAIDPKIFLDEKGDVDALLGELHDGLSLSTAEMERLQDAIARRIFRGGEREGRPLRFAWIRRHLSQEQYDSLKDKADAGKLPGIYFPAEFDREYPQGRLAAHVLGFSNIDGTGLEGVEKICDAFLQGEELQCLAEKDARNRKMLSIGGLDLDKRKGLTTVLTIDSTVQAISEEELAKAVEKYSPSSACALVMDPFTGDLLALANYPSFDPNDPAKNSEGRLNVALATIIEPGSTFKPFVWGEAYEKRLISTDTIFDCEHGAWRMDCGRTLHDAHGYGKLTAEMVLVKSSNIGMAKIAALLGTKGLYDCVVKLGFGKETGISLPAELPGTVHPLRKWNGYSMGSVPMGQEIAVTPLQLATAYSAIANGGILLKPRVLREMRDPSGQTVSTFPVKTKERVFTAQTCALLRNVLRKVVTDGTGKIVRMDEYPLGGKTGTAQLPINTAERAAGARGGYSPDRYVGSFVALAPYDVPRIIVLVSLREPKGAYYGGTVAAPAVKEISRRSLLYLKIPPRNLEEKGIMK